MGSSKTQKGGLRRNHVEDRMIELIDNVRDFEEFSQSLPGQLRSDVLSGKYTAEQLRKKYLPLVQARQIATAILEPDSAKAHSAANSILDRTEGKATEKHEHVHRLGRLKDEELDAMLISEMEEVNRRDDDSEGT